jgi:hypothetical protein
MSPASGLTGFGFACACNDSGVANAMPMALTISSVLIFINQFPFSFCFK